MKQLIFVYLCLFLQFVVAVDITIGAKSQRASRKLFGGYRITPRFCKPTRTSPESRGGPNICMFNHECIQRNGFVVGACMDGFLFGACCQLPTDSAGELVESDINPVTSINNDVEIASTPISSVDILSNGVSQIAQTLLNGGNRPPVIPPSQDEIVLQVGGDVPLFTQTGVTHSTPSETLILNGIGNAIHASDFKINSTDNPVIEDRQTTMLLEDTTVPYSKAPTIQISISSNKPTSFYQKPIFRPRPTKPSDADKYILIPTLTHASNSNKSQEIDAVVNIIQMLNSSTTSSTGYYTPTSKKPPSTSYIFNSSPIRRPDTTTPTIITTNKAPSTSYVFSTTFKPRRTTSALTTTTKKKTKPTKKKITTTTVKPTGYSTFANSPSAFVTSRPTILYNNLPTKKPASIVNTHVAGPGFSVTSSPGLYSSYPTPAPTLIVLGPSFSDNEVTDRPEYEEVQPPRPTRPPFYRPSSSTLNPVNSVTINNHVTQNIYSTSERPSPTVLITPKPSISSSLLPADYNAVSVEAQTNPDQLINFPPVRNPNLNMSNPGLAEDGFTTPAFIEDDALNDKVENFVNKIIQGLQEPFEGLKDVVYKKNTTSATTTKKPIKKQGTTTRKPTTTKTTTRRPVTVRRTTTKSTTRRPSTTTKKPKPSVKPVTTTTPESLIEEDNTLVNSDDFRKQCGIRPLLKSGRIVGGKGATFGEFPWQALVRESTWLGLFTKNKCGGVLISSKFVMTAAHCQPGFLASLVAVFGEFDISGDLESRRPISRNVRRVIVHRKYDPATFENDLALLELEAPIKFDAHIIPICLPRDGEDFTGRMATVSGWGRLKYGGGVPSVLQEVQVPIMENHVCQEMFRTAGHSKVILDSFLCAGYANGQKDSCEGDSGGPLVLQRPDGRYQLAGTVSHGIKCAAPYLPGVYMRTVFYKPWITAVTGID